MSRLSSCFWGRWGFFCFCGGYLNLIEFYIRAVEWGGGGGGGNDGVGIIHLAYNFLLI